MGLTIVRAYYYVNMYILLILHLLVGPPFIYRYGQKSIQNIGCITRSRKNSVNLTVIVVVFIIIVSIIIFKYDEHYKYCFFLCCRLFLANKKDLYKYDRRSSCCTSSYMNWTMSDDFPTPPPPTVTTLYTGGGPS